MAKTISKSEYQFTETHAVKAAEQQLAQLGSQPIDDVPDEIVDAFLIALNDAYPDIDPRREAWHRNSFVETFCETYNHAIDR